MIPRRLHFTWKSETLPPVMQRYLDAWKRLHPDYEITLWTDATMRAFVAEAWPELLGTYDAYPKMIQRADAFRYMVLGKLGGVYADLDVEPFQPIDDGAALNRLEQWAGDAATFKAILVDNPARLYDFA